MWANVAMCQKKSLHSMSNWKANNTRLRQGMYFNVIIGT